MVILVLMLVAGLAGFVVSWRRGAGRSAWVVPVALIAAAAILIIPARSSGGLEWSSATALGAVFFLFALALTAVVSSLAGVDPEADEHSERLIDGNIGQRLLQRWLHRVRWRRYVGGVIGVILGLWWTVIADGQAFFVIAIGAVALASLSTELHHLRPDRHRARTAELTQRRLGDYTKATHQLVLAGIALVAAGMAGFGVVAKPEDRWASAVWALLAVVTVALTVGLQWRAATRRRSALPAEVRRADDFIRRLAVQNGIAQPGTALALLLLGQAFITAGAGVVGVVVSWVALGWWWSNRGLGLDQVEALQPVPQTQPGLTQPIASA